MNRFSSQKMIAMAIFAIVFSVSQVGFGQDAVKEKVDLEIVIKPVGDQMLYETTEFTVTAGSKVRVIMENTATSEAMLHNVVILKPETDKAKIGIAAIQAGADKGYIPVDPASTVLHRDHQTRREKRGGFYSARTGRLSIYLQFSGALFDDAGSDAFCRQKRCGEIKLLNSHYKQQKSEHLCSLFCLVALFQRIFRGIIGHDFILHRSNVSDY